MPRMGASGRQKSARRKRSPSPRARRGMANPESRGIAASGAPSSEPRPEPRFVVPPSARAQLLAELPLKPVTLRALVRAGWATLGDVDNVPFSALGGAGQTFGLEAVGDLASVIALIALGRLVIVPRGGSGPFDGLVGAIDVALDRLDPVDRRVLLLRFGAGCAPPLSLSETARRCGLGGGSSGAGFNGVASAVKRLLRIVGPQVQEMIVNLEVRVAARGEPLAEILERHVDPTERGKHGAAFYARLLEKVVPALRRMREAHR